MCLTVRTKHIPPRQGVRATKRLFGRHLARKHGAATWETPFYGLPFKAVDANTGWFMVNRKKEKKEKEKRLKDIYFLTGAYPSWVESVHGGMLHAFEGRPEDPDFAGVLYRTEDDIEGESHGDFYFRALAYNVHASGWNGDIVCDFLYIPWFDKKGEYHPDKMVDGKPYWRHIVEKYGRKP